MQFIVSMNVPQRHCLPEHLKPFPSNPFLQRQENPPAVLVQTAFLEQASLLRHSSISWEQKMRLCMGLICDDFVEKKRFDEKRATKTTSVLVYS